MDGQRGDFYLVKTRMLGEVGMAILALSTGNDRWMGVFLTAQSMRSLSDHVLPRFAWSG